MSTAANDQHEHEESGCLHCAIHQTIRRWLAKRAPIFATLDGDVPFNEQELHMILSRLAQVTGEVLGKAIDPYQRAALLTTLQGTTSYFMSVAINAAERHALAAAPPAGTSGSGEAGPGGLKH